MKQVNDLLETLQARRAEIVAQTEPLTAKREALAAKIAPIEVEMRELAEQIKVIRRGTTGDELFELDQQIGALSRVTKKTNEKAV